MPLYSLYSATIVQHGHERNSSWAVSRPSTENSWGRKSALCSRIGLGMGGSMSVPARFLSVLSSWKLGVGSLGKSSGSRLTPHHHWPWERTSQSLVQRAGGDDDPDTHCYRHLHMTSQLLYLLVRIYLYFVSLTFHYSRVDHVPVCSTLLQLQAGTLHAVESILLCICMSPWQYLSSSK